MIDMSPDDIVAEIVAAANDCETPTGLRERLEAIADAERELISEVRTLIFALYIDAADELERRGHKDREAVERIIAQELESAAAVIIMAMYRRLGRPHSAGRFAIVAHQMFKRAEQLPQIDGDAP